MTGRAWGTEGAVLLAGATSLACTGRLVSVLSGRARGRMRPDMLWYGRQEAAVGATGEGQPVDWQEGLQVVLQQGGAADSARQARQ